MPKSRSVQPIFQTWSGRYYNWAAIVAYAQAIPGTWLLVLPDVPQATVRAVREQRHLDLQNLTGGTLVAAGRNLHLNDEGQRRVDLFVRWIPLKETIS